jgi:hypothetical protein
MAQKNHTGLIIGIAVIGGFVAYEWWKGQQAGGTTTTTNVQDTAGGGTTSLPVSTVAVANTPVETISNAVQASIPPTGPVDINGNPLPSGITQEVYNKVYSWAHSDGRAPVITMAQAMIPAEYNGMYDIITTQWTTGVAATPAQVKFWNDLRDKYDPQHKQW